MKFGPGGRWTRTLTLGVLILTSAAAARTVLQTVRMSPPAGAGYIQQAEEWLGSNVQPGSRLITDAHVRADLIHSQWPATRLATPSSPPSSWRTYDFMVVTPALRAAPSLLATAAMGSTTTIASFGPAGLRTDIVRVDVFGIDAAQALDAAQAKQSTQDGTALATNPRIHLEAQAAIQLSEGVVDTRVIAILVALSAQHPLGVLRFSDAANSGTVRGPLHAVILDTIDGVPVTQSGTQTTDVSTWFAAQNPPYRCATLGVDGDGNLLVALPYVGLSQHL